MKRLARPQRQLSKKYHRLQQQQQKHSYVHWTQRRRRRQPHFIINGGIVEVSSKEEGFDGVWFTATIVRDRRRTIGKVQVEYKSLLRDDDPSKQLRENVKAELIRPVPPLEDHHRVTFNVGDTVDAYHADGWWTGTVTKVLEDSSFVVFFKNPPHDIQFGHSDLRIHRDWIKGAWVPPVIQETEKTEVGKMYFCKEKRVEVSFDGAFPDVWFPATVLEDKGNGAFLVECELSDGKGGSCIRKETVNSLHIRPFPPFSNSKNFLLLEKVDAFYDFGWWRGVITKELTDSRYTVNINHTKEDREFGISELRAYMEWKHGDWFTESQDVSIPSYQRNNENNIEKSESNIGMSVPLTNSASMKSSSQEKSTFLSTSLEKEIELAVPGNDKPLAFVSSPTSNEKSSHVASPDYVSVEKSHEGLSSRKRGKTKRARKVGKEENALAGSRITGENKVQVKNWKDSAGGKEGNEAEDVPGDCLTGDTSIPIVLGLACDNTRTPGSQRSYRSNGEGTAKRGKGWGNFDETKLHAVKVTNRLEAVDGIEKRKRGRPRKSLAPASIPATDASGEASTLGQVLATNGRLGSSNMGSSNDQMKPENQLGSIKSATSPSSTGGENAVEASSKPPSSTGSENAVEASGKPPPKTGGENAEEASRVLREKQPTKRAKIRKTNLNVISKVHGVASPNSVEGNTAEESDMNEEVSMEESPNNTSDNQPLAIWLGNLHSPTRADSPSKGSSLTRCNAEAISEHMEVVEEGTTAVTPAAAVDEFRPVGIELQNSPFEKRSPLWSALESMEIFRKLPQKPHFQPLEHVKETVREGLAIGSMVTFTGVVEKATKLQFDDTKESIDAILETLLELETHGFDVGAIRERVVHLGQMKEKQEKIEEEVEKLNSEMTAQEAEKSKIDKEIEEINSQMSELQEKLSGVMVMKAKKTGEIESLQMRLKGVEDSIISIRSEFDGQVSWP